MAAPAIMLTNDDGVEAPGLSVLREALSELGEVTVVAPTEDKSAVGRAMSRSVTVHEREYGYAIEGTPADCVVAGLESLVPETDLVVAGCNRGANLGTYTLGRSGTVSAAVEAAFFEVPALAVSLYVDTGGASFREFETTREDYREAVRATRYLAEHAVDAGVFERADYLNVNAPLPDEAPAPMRVTSPSRSYDMGAERTGTEITLTDRMWDRMERGEVPDPADSDRRAVVDGAISVSPLTAPHTTEHHEALDALASTYEPAD